MHSEAIEAWAVGLPVDAAVAQRCAARRRGGEQRAAPVPVEAGHRVAPRVVEGGDRHLQGDEVVRADQAADLDLRLQRADRADRQRPVAARLEQGAQVGGVVDQVGEAVLAAAVALQNHGAVPLRGGDDLVATGADGAAAEDDR
jgi:hypothetical protein